jgi:hypothetical protein
MQPIQPIYGRRLRIMLLGALALSLASASRASAQAALFLEQPYGVFGTLNPTGHAALYLERICADTPVHLRPCSPGETGTVLSRYKGMGGYDWVAIPLIPYLYSVEQPTQVPDSVDEDTVTRLRNRYRESHLGEFGEDLPPGSFFNGGWTQLVGTAYDRRTYAFRFATTPAQDRELIDRLNARPNRSHFNILYNNCADFDRFILNHYFPQEFKRAIFPDAGITTPKHLTYQLVNYAKRHPEAQLTILEIPQVPGFRRKSRAVHGVAESVIKNGYVLPIVVLNPYVAGGLLADYLVRGRYNLVPKDPITADADHLYVLTDSIPETPAQSDSPALASSPAPGSQLTGSAPRPENPSDPAQAASTVPKGEDSAPSQLKEPTTQE